MCSPIGHNNTKHFLCPIRSRHPLEFLEMVRWESVPRGSFARNENFRPAFSPDPTDCPWVSEDAPVPKEGNLEEPANNRPISLLPILLKVSQRLAQKQFVEFLTTHDKLTLDLSKWQQEYAFDRNCPHKCCRQHFESNRWKICLVTATAWYVKSFWQP